jgi:hypothetical protein
MRLTDWTIQRPAGSGLLTPGGARPTGSDRGTAAQCFRAPSRRCRPTPAARVTLAGAMSAAWAAVDLNAGTAWPDEASFVALADALAAVERCSELCPVSWYSDGRTSRADKPCGAGGPAERPLSWGLATLFLGVVKTR